MRMRSAARTRDLRRRILVLGAGAATQRQHHRRDHGDGQDHRGDLERQQEIGEQRTRQPRGVGTSPAHRGGVGRTASPCAP